MIRDLVNLWVKYLNYTITIGLMIFISACNGVGISPSSSETNTVASTNTTSDSIHNTNQSLKLSSGSNPTVTIDCPQYKGTLTYGQNISSGGYTWRFWAQANSLAINTYTDVNYGPGSISSSQPQTLSCNGGWPNIQYAFSTIVNYINCKPYNVYPYALYFSCQVNVGQPVMTSPSTTNVPVDSSFTFQFPTNVNTASVTYGSTIGIYDSVTSELIPCSEPIWLNSYTLKLTPVAPLAYKHSYSFREVGVTNTDNYIENSTTISFTTLGIKVEALPEEMHLGSPWTDTLVNTPVGQFGLTGYLITNETPLPVNLINLININVPFPTSVTVLYPPPPYEFWIDGFRSSCYQQVGADLFSSITLNPGSQCSIVVHYQPTSYGENGTLTFTVAGTDTENSQLASKSVNTPYSSRPN